jgi:hypothetical protein
MSHTKQLEHVVKMLVADNTYKGKGVPIDFFDKHEQIFRKFMREDNLRAIYRGPRRNRKIYAGNSDHYFWFRPTMTLREDATRVKFYYK